LVERTLGCVLVVAVVAVNSVAAPCARADDSPTVLEFRYTPVARAQVALWIEDASGRFLATVALTEAVAYRGIGNRPGASEMNSGYRWPYGRREGVLPIWAHRRAAAPGAKAFSRVIFQSRVEGFGTRSTNDYSPDAYYCLQFDMALSSRDKLDAVSCATPFHSDKGRYLTPDDVAKNYAEPWQQVGLDAGTMQPLPLTALYPPRMDVERCTQSDVCYDHADVSRFAADARDVMPDIDAVARATAPGEMPQALLFTVPQAWVAGDYVAWIEINVEGDYNDHWNNTSYPSPHLPDSGWDTYAMFYGYAYRGQPSVVFKLPFTLGASGEPTFGVDAPAGRSSWDFWKTDYGRLEAISLASGDATGLVATAGSGVDRLRASADGTRFALQVKHAGAVAPAPTVEADGGMIGQLDAGGPPGSDAGLTAGNGAQDKPGGTTGGEPIGAVGELSLRHYDNELRAHTWIVLHFAAAHSERPIHEYEVRVATEPIIDEASFIRAGRPAKSATDAAEGAAALMVPVDAPEGQVIEVAIGDLVAQTHYYVAVRATDDLNRHGPIAVAQITTPARKFATVTPCFVASAAYGSALASEVSVLRGVRDRYLLSTAPGRVLVAAYYAAGPFAARGIEQHATLRAIVRGLLAPLLALAKALP
jgi:hypothetical protein